MADNIKYRKETDTMGVVHVPDWALWGANTQRAYNNCRISDYTIPNSIRNALAYIKKSAAHANGKLGLLSENIIGAIEQAATEVFEGKLNQHFPVDVFQTGSGTSWNMNINEVIANRASEILGGKRGERSPVHPNDHVNKGQSSNDVIPSAIQIACRMEIDSLLAPLKKLEERLTEKAVDFSDIPKLGRTHMQDAVPMTVGQEFSGYAELVRKRIKGIEECVALLEEIPLGGTAVGTGLNCHAEFADKAIEQINVLTGFNFIQAENLFAAISSRDAQIALMGALNALAGTLMKIAQDIRLLSSGPRAGLGELILPELQPGSSIMPGKVNPIVPEMVIQSAAHIMGKNQSVGIANQNSPLQVNMAMPLIAFETLESIKIMQRAVCTFDENCIRGIECNEEKCSSHIEWSLAIITPLAEKIGYDWAASIAKKAYSRGKTVRQVVLDEGILDEDQAEALFNPMNMIGPLEDEL